MNAESWGNIPGGKSMQLPYDAGVAVQKNALNAESIANVVFTIAWDTADNGSGPVDIDVIANGSRLYDMYIGSYRSGYVITRNHGYLSDVYFFKDG